MAVVVEVESKFDVGPDATKPDLDHLPGVLAVDPPTRTELVASYFDTAQLDLLNAGITMRRRSGGVDAGWHLKVPWQDARSELREPATDGSAVPDAFTAVVRGLTRDRPVVQVATLRTLRTLIALRGVGGQLVAEFCDDLVRAEGTPYQPFAPVEWREWEFELSRPDPVLAAAGARALHAAGGSPALVPSKLARVLPSPVPRPATDVAVGSAPTMADVLQTYVRSQVERMRHLDPVVRANLPDAVHQMRVTSRRLRSVLAGYRADFDPAVTEPLRAELGWLIGQLGRARDLEVMAERVNATAGQQHPIAAAVAESTREQHRDAHRDAVDAMLSPRYFTLMDALADIAAEAPWSSHATRGAETELVVCLHRQWRRLEKAADHVGSSHGRKRGRRLHDVRRAAKRLRYSTEAAQPVLGARVDGLLVSLSQIQDILGRHHDALVARDFVAGLAQRGSTTQTSDDLRQVRRRLVDEAAADEREFERCLDRLRRSPQTRWLRRR